MPTTVEPSEFQFVHFDAGEIAAVTDELVAKIGLDPSTEVVIEIDETSALGHTELVSIDPVRIQTQSGALENPKKLRHFSAEVATDTLGRYLLRAADRMDDGFADAPTDDDLTLEQRAAWDVYTTGRLHRMGFVTQRQRFLYTFRNRHGFTDTADAAFEQLWNGDGLTWADIDKISAEAAAVNPGALQR